MLKAYWYKKLFDVQTSTCSNHVVHTTYRCYTVARRRMTAASASLHIKLLLVAYFIYK